MPNNQVGERYCHKHGIYVTPFFSKKKNRYYCMHHHKNLVTGKSETCWVNSEEEEEAFREKHLDYAMDNMIGVERGEDGHVINN